MAPAWSHFSPKSSINSALLILHTSSKLSRDKALTGLIGPRSIESSNYFLSNFKQVDVLLEIPLLQTEEFVYRMTPMQGIRAKCSTIHATSRSGQDRFASFHGVKLRNHQTAQIYLPQVGPNATIHREPEAMKGVCGLSNFLGFLGEVIGRTGDGVWLSFVNSFVAKAFDSANCQLLFRKQSAPEISRE